METEAPESNPIELKSHFSTAELSSTPYSLPSSSPRTPPPKYKETDGSSPLSTPPLLPSPPFWGSFHTLSQSDSSLSPPQPPALFPTLQASQQLSPGPPPPEKTNFLQVHSPRGNDFDTNYLVARFLLAIRIWIGTRSGVQVARIEFETATIATQVLGQQGGEGGGQNRAYSLYAERENEYKWWEEGEITCTDVKSYWRSPKFSEFRS